MSRAKRGDSLATSMIVLTLMIVTVSVTTVGIAALVGVYDLAINQAEARQEAVLQVISIEIEGRLDAAARVIDRASDLLMDPASTDIDRTRLASLYESGIENVDRLLVADAEGAVLSAYPVFDAPRSVADLPLFLSGIDDTTSFDLSYVDERQQLWIARAVETPRGEHLVLARVRTQFLAVLVTEFSSVPDWRTVSIVDAENRVLIAGPLQAEIDESSLRLEPPDSVAEPGGASAATLGAARLTGQAVGMTRYPGLDWRIVVLEPQSHIISSTWTALLPAVLALVGSATFSLVLAVLFARRLVAPLRTLESYARSAVSGAYMEPLHTSRQDEVGRLAEAFNAIGLRLNALQDLSQLLAGSSSLDQVLGGIISAVAHIAPSSGVAVLLLDESGRDLSIARSEGAFTGTGEWIPVASKPFLAQALESAGPSSFSGSRADLADSIPGLRGEGEASGLVVPLTAGSEPLGLIVVLYEQDRRFSEAEVEMVRTFSAQAAVAVYNSRLFEFESASRQEAEAMRTVAETLSKPLDLEESLSSVMRVTTSLFDVSSASVALLDRESFGLPAEGEDYAGERALARAWSSAWASGDGDLVVRVRPEDDPEIARYLGMLGAEEALLLTVMRGGEPAAVVSLAQDRPGRRFTARERSRALSLTKQLALALDNAYHYAEARSRASNLETVFRISQAVSSSLQIKVVLNRVLDVVQKIFSADTVSLMQYEETTRTISTVMARGIISTEMLHFDCAPGQDIPGQVFSTGEPLKVDDLMDAETDLAVTSVAQGLHSMLAVPLLARGRSIGVLSVYSTLPSAFSSEDMGLLHTFASQAALAIDTADMYGREHHVASVLQASILPKSLPSYPEIDTASVYLAAGEESEIGGDYYDLFKDPEGRIILAIGDVCGKGVEAATKTSKIKYMVRGLVAAGCSPAKVLSEVNQAVAESGDPSDIVTLWVGVLDTGASTLCYADGGHPPAILRRAVDSTTERLETTGPLLGAIADARFDQIVVGFEPDDLVVLYTDGVTEARRGNKFFGEGRVRRAVGAGGSAGDVADRLLGSLDRFVPGALRDDAAILVVRRTTPVTGPMDTNVSGDA